MKVNTNLLYARQIISLQVLPKLGRSALKQHNNKITKITVGLCDGGFQDMAQWASKLQNINITEERHELPWSKQQLSDSTSRLATTLPSLMMSTLPCIMDRHWKVMGKSINKSDLESK